MSTGAAVAARPWEWFALYWPILDSYGLRRVVCS